MTVQKPKSLYEIAFTQRDLEVQSLEAQRAEIASEVEGSMREYAKLSRRKKIGKIKKKRITALLLETDGR